MPATVPVLAANVHAALTEADFAALADAEGAAAAALAEVRALQNAHLCERFNTLAAQPQQALPVKGGAAAWRLHALLTADEGRLRRETLETAQPPPGLAPAQQLHLYLRLLCGHPAFWGADTGELREQLLTATRERGAFAEDWEKVRLHGDGTATVEDRFRNLGGVRAYLSTGGAECAGTEDVALCRAARVTADALLRLQLPVLSAVLHFTSGAVLQLIATPCSASGRATHDLSRDMVVSAQLPGVSRAAPVLTVTCSGIQHDEPHSGGAARSVRVEHVEGLGSHPRHGVHDSAAVELAVPALLRTARFIGEVHFMTQIAKEILRTRPDADSTVAALTQPQRGVHLRDEARLCAFWDEVRGALSEPERRCLELGVQRMHEQPLITYTALAGRVSSAVAPTTVLLESAPMPMPSLHHVEVRVRVKGNRSMPCAMLARGPRSLNVRVDNEFVLETHTVCFP